MNSSQFPTIYISELMDEETLSRLLPRAAEHCPGGIGIELISLSISDNLDRYEDTLRSTQAMLSRLGHPPVSIHGPFLDLNPMSFDRTIREATFQRFALAYDAARTLSAERIVYHSGMIPSVYYLEGWAERMTDFWMMFLDGRDDITVCMENVLDREIAPFLQIAEDVQTAHPNFGICLDLGHAHCYSHYPPFDWASQLAPYIRHLHLHDNDGVKDQHLGLGCGTVPWQETLARLSWPHPQITCTIECAEETFVLESLKKLI